MTPISIVGSYLALKPHATTQDFIHVISLMESGAVDTTPWHYSSRLARHTAAGFSYLATTTKRRRQSHVGVLRNVQAQ
jgi:hypothetical protein